MMFTYQYQRYGEPYTEEYTDLVELFERVWSDIDHANGMPMGVLYRDAQFLGRDHLIRLCWLNVMNINMDHREYFTICASIAKILFNIGGV